MDVSGQVATEFGSPLQRLGGSLQGVENRLLVGGYLATGQAFRGALARV